MFGVFSATGLRTGLACAAVVFASLAQAQAVFKVTAIPDESPTELARKAAPLVKYLEKALGMKVEFTPVTDYAASVEALANKQVDMAWFGGFTFVQANVRSGGKAVPLVQREEDEKFRSVFITSRPHNQNPGRPQGQERQLWLAVQHLGPPDAAQLPAASQHRPRQRLQTCGLFWARTTPPLPPWPQARWKPVRLNISVWEKFVADGKVDTTKVQACSTPPQATSTTTGPCTPTCPPPARKIGQGLPEPGPQHGRR
jgi:phosphonate transport system substrate-binding protein